MVYKKSGEIYKGSWVNNKKNGKGYITTKIGHIHLGDFKDSKFHGLGAFYENKNGKLNLIHISEYKFNKKNGNAIIFNDSQKKIAFAIIENNKITRIKKKIRLNSKNINIAIQEFSSENSNYSLSLLNTSNNYQVSTSNTDYSFNNLSSGNTQLYYNSATGGMKECATTPINGRCTKFKPFNRNSYNKESLFYNSKSNRMQKCYGAILVSGECTDFGDYNYSQKDRDKLYYDKSTMRMSSCKVLDYKGGCEIFDIKSKKRNSTTYYVPTIPQNPQDLISYGLRLMDGSCTLGVNC